MITAMRTEWLKIRTTRGLLGLLGATVVVTAIMATLEASRAGAHRRAIPSLATSVGLSDVLTSTMFGLLLAAVFGVMLASGEFRHRTATATYLDQPRRNVVLLAKGTVGALVGTLFGLVASTVTAIVAFAFVSAKGYPVAVSGTTVVRFFAGAMLAAGLMAALGVAIGSLVRSQVAGTIAVFAWALVLESVLGGVFPSVGPYLPYTAATTIAGATQGVMTPLSRGTAPLPLIGATLLVAGLSAVVATVASKVTVRRDVA